MAVAVPTRAPTLEPSPIRGGRCCSSWPPAHIRLVLRSALRRIEFHRFLIALSVRPGKSLTISDHRLYRCAKAQNERPCKLYGTEFVGSATFESDTAKDSGGWAWTATTLSSLEGVG